MLCTDMERELCREDLEVSYVVKHSFFLSTEEGSRAGDAARPSSCQVLEVRFPCVVRELRCLAFRNFYFHSLSVKCLSCPCQTGGAVAHSSSRCGREGWKACTGDVRLMPSCHRHAGAQAWRSLKGRDFRFRLSNVHGLRFILRQPSGRWRRFEIQQLTCFQAPPTPGLATPPLPSQDHALTPEHQDLDSISEELQELLSLGQRAAESNENSQAQYLIDYRIPYEVNILSDPT